MNRNPNIVLIMTDQQRWDSLGCYGCEAIETPNLDRLAAEGVRYDRCYVSNPICTPSRASLMTGKPVPAHGVERLYDVLSEEQELFPVHLQAQGYRTALFGKLHVSAIRHELENRRDNDGFDVYEWCPEPSLLMDDPGQAYGQWLKSTHPDFYKKLLAEGRQVDDVPQECHMTHWAASRTVDFIENANPEQPFFCKMSVFDPHNPYHDYPQAYRELVDASKIPEPIRDRVPMSDLPEAVRREHAHGYMLSEPKKGPSWGKDAAVPEPKEPTPEELAHHYRPERILKDRVDYLASIALLDAEVGRVLEALDTHGLAENTLVVFCSDHGDMLGDHGLLAKGAYFYEPSVRVPLLMRWPGGIVAGTVSENPVQLHDLAATLLSASGESAEVLHERMPDSKNLLREEDGAGRAFSVCMYHGTGICDTGRYFDPPIHGAMLCDGRHKLTIYFPEGQPGAVFEGQLFDLQADPGEMENLWSDPAHRSLRDTLIESLLGWYQSHAGSEVSSRR